MRVTRHGTAGALLAEARAFLLRDEVENHLVLGIAGELDAAPAFDGPWLATIEEQGKTVACALQTPPRPLILTRAPAAAVDALVEGMMAWGVELPGVVGPAETANRFARLWSRRTGKEAQLGTHQRMYRLDAVEPGLEPLPGRLRQAGEDDLDRVTEWIEAFQREAMPVGDSRELAVTKIRQGAVWLWDYDSGPVTMAAWAGPTPHGIRINLVYTPPELRGRGYATACVAALSRRLLEEGRRFCALYADLANPTSNRIYLRIGYRPVCDVDEIRFV